MDTNFSSLKKPRKLYLHIGSDKAGSTALQLHLAANRDVLEKNGVYVPKIGGAAITGHHGVLFQDFGQKNVEALITEIDDLPADQKVLMSWEGMHVLSEGVLNSFSNIFRDCDVHIVFYIREQADVIQTGFLQQIKGQEKNAQEIYGEIDFKVESRDYYRTVKKFERCFPSCSLDVVLYDRNSFPKKNIVYDLFGRIIDDLEFDTINIYDSEINSSLSLDDVIALALMEDGCPTLLDDAGAGKKSRIIDLLLSGEATRNNRKSSYFFTQRQVEECRSFYHESNTLLIREYNVQEKLISEQKPVWSKDEYPLPLASSASISDKTELDNILAMADIVYMDRDSRNRYQIPLSSVLKDGWSLSEQGDRWNSCQKSSIYGSVRLQSLTLLTKYLRFFVNGGYAPGAEPVSSVFVNGDYMGDFDLRICSFQYPLEKITFPYTVSIELIHKGTSSISDANTPSIDEGKTYYRLKNFVCTFARTKDAPRPDASAEE